ncbi:Hypothetical protein BHY_1031 (plasmid) [Borrelia nietonii YOR]|uniref:Uncharacterized protein n=2 Tax=Borrelia TaxID=138 RepID=W5SAJ7_9SPIR|nr:Hypothetical protein BHY_1031 [Borrelia nietonii YOR]
MIVKRRDFMERFGMVLCMLVLVLGCTADGKVRDAVSMRDGRAKGFSRMSMLVPFLQKTRSKACDDLKSLVEHFKEQLLEEHLSDINGIPYLIDDNSDFIVRELADYGMVPKNTKSHDVYIALGHDRGIVKALKSILSQFTWKVWANEGDRDARIVSLLLFNLEQVVYYTNSLCNSLSDEKLNEIRTSGAATVENITQITYYLFAFMQARDELIGDFKKVISGAALVRGNRLEMESELKKIVNDGKIKEKIGSMYSLLRDIDNLVDLITKVVF